MSDYADDVSIANEEVLYRRVKLNVDLITFDPTSIKLRPTSTAFNNTMKPLELPAGSALGAKPERVETYMSVFVENRLLDLRLDSNSVLDGLADFVLVKLTSGQVRELGIARESAQQVFYEPEAPPPPCMAAHGGVAGKKTKGLRKDLSEQAVWVVPPSVEWVIENRATLRIPDDFAVEEQFETLLS
ncbi:hypothetical protein BH11CYA1_BH11CYA1_16150 [soil metagenome]